MPPKNLILGIDPGKTGAAALLVPDGSLVQVVDFAGTYAPFIELFKNDISLAVIERVHSHPNDGHVGAFTFGQNFGFVLGVLASHSTPTTFVTPSVWKKECGLSRDKSASVALALKLLPTAEPFLTLKKHHNRAEALLLAYFGVTRLSAWNSTTTKRRAFAS